MKVLAIDVGSSSVKMGLMQNGRLLGRDAREEYPTRYLDDRAEVDPEAVVRAIARAARSIPSARTADLLALSTMSPSWIAVDRKGKALTPIITHQDRRSIDIAVQIEKRVGKATHLRLAGNRPVPGGISSTTCAWFLQHERSLMRRADLVGHVQTFLHRRFCGSRVVDPSHASFMGVYSTVTMKGWNERLCDAIGLSPKLLPEIRESNQVGGKLLPEAARMLGLPAGLPMLVGMIDTGAAMLLTGAKVGQLVNVVGTTDVLALCTDNPQPHERLLTRALGVGRKWTSVGTLASAGSSIDWAQKQLFGDMPDKAFYALLSKVAKARDAQQTVTFAPYLAGDRCSVEQRRGAFENMTLATTREQMLAAMVDALARASADRLDLLGATGTRILRRVMISGGGDAALARIMHRDWPGKWSFYPESEAAMRGLAKLAEAVHVG